MNIPSISIYQQFANEIEPHIYQSNLMNFAGFAGIIATSCAFLGVIAISAKNNPYRDLSVNDQIPTPRINLIKLAFKIGVVALCVMATIYAFVYGEYHRICINQVISKAVIAENGQMTKDKQQFLKNFGGKATELFGKSNIYLNLQSHLMKYMPSARFFNTRLGVIQYVDPNYTPPSRD